MRLGTLVVLGLGLSALGLGCGSDGGNSPPVLVSLEANLDELGPDELAVLVARVEDADGFEDVLGGVLRTASGDPVGAFEPHGQGVWALELGLLELGSAEPLDFFGSEERAYAAVFVDGAGQEATQELTLTLRCPIGQGGCGTGCEPLDQDQACGACGQACAADQICDASQAVPACTLAQPLDGFGGALGAEFCGLIFRCCEPAEIASLGLGITDELSCALLYEVLLREQLEAPMRAGLDTGRGHFDPILARVCLERIPILACDIRGDPLDDCEPYWEGLQPEGMACARDLECADGLHCAELYPDVEGVCLPYRALGAPCVSGQAPLCEPEALYCNATLEECASRKPEGQACASYTECQRGLDCAAGLCTAPPVICDGL